MFPVSLPLAILILDNFPFCCHFLSESALFRLSWMIFCPFKFWAMEMTVKSFPRLFVSLSNSYLLGSESQNHGTADIGRELCSSCCSIPLFKQSQEPASTPGTYGCLPSGHMELCASFLKYYLISSSPTKNKSSLLQNFPSSPGPWLWRGKKVLIWQNWGHPQKVNQ